MKKLTKEEFVERSIKIHNNKYDYSLVEYVNNNTAVKIICKKHNEIFVQAPLHHMNGDGCPLCAGNKKLDNETFIKRAREIHNDKYDYSLVDYHCIGNKVKIICKIHGIFEQSPNHHISKKKRGCPKCNGGSRKTTEYFIEQSKEVHGDKYDYSLVEYINCKTNIKIICKIHGVFEQQPKHHINGCNCPKCRSSKGESLINNILLEKNIKFIREYKFNNCKNKKKLPFDFYLPDYNMCIEYDGEQHFKSINFYGGEKAFIERKIKDEIKTDFCKKNDIVLLRISFKENIENKLNNYGFRL